MDKNGNRTPSRKSKTQYPCFPNCVFVGFHYALGVFLATSSIGPRWETGHLLVGVVQPNLRIIYGKCPPVKDMVYFEADPYAAVFDSRKAKAMLGWEPKFDWRDFETWEL